MITFESIASSSHGNAYVVSDGETKLLLECGIPMKRLQKHLSFTTSSLDACLITHEHQDHARSVFDILDSGVPVYASEGTACALGAEDIRTLAQKRTVQIGTFRVLPFRVFHDAAEPFGYLLCSGDDRLLFATDTVNIPYTFPRVGIAALECNHDRSMIKSGDVEPWRVRAMKNHMDVSRLCEYLRRLDRGKLRQIYLLHMSDAFSDEAAFVSRIAGEFGISVTACAREA